MDKRVRGYKLLIESSEDKQELRSFFYLARDDEKISPEGFNELMLAYGRKSEELKK